MKKLSVIVPTYNVEQYISECIESILNQSYSSIEIILIDDGSQDQTPQICKEYERKYDNITFYTNAHNGISHSRNIGIKKASGEYIAFVDSDDFVDKFMYEKLISCLENNGADMAICNINVVDGEGKELITSTRIEEQMMAGRDALPFLDDYSGWGYVSPCNKVYRREIFEGIVYPEGKIHEDECVAHKIYMACNKVCFIEESLYNYRQQQGSIMHVKDVMGTLDGFDAVSRRFVDYHEKGFIDLLPKTLEHSKYFLEYISKLNLSDDSHKKRNKDIRTSFKKMVKALGKEAGIVNRIISISPYVYYRIRGLMKMNAS